MRDINIKMIFNKETGEKEIFIDYEKDRSSLPLEHEKRHRQIIEILLGKGILKPEDLGNVHVSRSPTGLVESEPNVQSPVPISQKG
jgi:hypothetical protein